MKLKSILTVTLILFVSMTRIGWCGGEEGDTPDAVMLEYFKAAQANDFSATYDLISDKMKDGRTREQYIDDWNNVMKMAQVEIVRFGVTSYEINGDKAMVNAWSEASDVFNVLGIFEKEIDHFVLVDGVWKLDITEVLMEEVTEVPTE